MTHWNASSMALINDIIWESNITPQYPGSAINRAVYKRDYPTLGHIIGEIQPFWQEFPMLELNDLIGLSLDGHNGFEEYVCTLLERLFTNLNCFAWVDGDEVLDHHRLRILIDALESSDTGSGEWVSRIRMGGNE